MMTKFINTYVWPGLSELKMEIRSDITFSCAYELFDSCYVDGLTQHCSNSIANALELLQSCAKPLMYEAKCDYTVWKIFPSLNCIFVKAYIVLF